MAAPDSVPGEQTVPLATKAIRGAFWTGSPFLLQMFIRLLFYSWLAQEAMGTFDAALLLVMFLALVSDLGLWSALVHRRAATDLHFSTAFWTCLGSGVLITALATLWGAEAIELLTTGIGHLMQGAGLNVSAAAADPLTRGEYSRILGTLSLLLPCAAVSGLFRARLQRELLFRRIAVAEVGSVLIYAVFAVALLEPLQIMGPVVSAVIREAALLAGLIVSARWLPRFSFDIQALREILGFGLNFTGSRALNYAVSALPALVVLSALGKVWMVYYTFSLQLTFMPLTRISTILTRVFFPTFSSVQEDDSILRRGYLKSAQAVALLYWPVLAVIYVFAPDGIELMREVRGRDYSPVLTPLRLLIVATMLKAVGTGVGSMFLAKGKANWTFYWAMFTMIILLPLLLWSVSLGLTYVSAVMAATSFLFLVLSQLLTNRLIGLRYGEYLQALARPALVTAFLLLSATALRPYLPGSALAVCLEAALVSLLLGILALRLFAWDMCWNLWRSLRGQTIPSAISTGAITH